MAFQTSTLYPRIRALLSSSAGLLCRGRVDCQTVGVKFKHMILSSPSPLPKRPLHSAPVGRGKNLPTTCNRAASSLLPSSLLPSSDTANRARKFSTTTATLLTRFIIRGGSLRPVALLAALGVTAVAAAAVASVHTSARVTTMAAGPEDKNINLSSAEGDWKETKDFLLSLSVKDRRQYYRSRSYVALEDIPVWKPTATDASEKPHYIRNDKLDQKISVYSGDITQLEIGAIVNAANKTLLGGGGVDGAIHRTAGPKLKKECSTLHGCETGQAKITCGYGLPAKYVIHTVGPVAVGGVGEEERNRLSDCYRNSLTAATAPENQVRTVAFPCISTGIYGYPPEQAVHTALATVREYLDKHHDKLDRVIFCVFLPADKELYEKNLPLYFPGAR